jgi:hypothetical protein
MCRRWRAAGERAATPLEAMSDEPPDPPPRLLFGKITPGNAHATLNRVAIAWTVIIAVQISERRVDFDPYSWPLITFQIQLWAAAGAYFVRSRKSRVVAIAQFAYVLLGGFTAHIPYVRDQTPLFLCSMDSTRYLYGQPGLARCPGNLDPSSGCALANGMEACRSDFRARADHRSVPSRWNGGGHALDLSRHRRTCGEARDRDRIGLVPPHHGASHVEIPVCEERYDKERRRGFRMILPTELNCSAYSRP